MSLHRMRQRYCRCLVLRRAVATAQGSNATRVTVQVDLSQMGVG